MKALYDLVKQFEGCKLKAYKCPAGVWTCGWGSTGPDVTENTVWTQQQADDRLENDLGKFMTGVLRVSPILKAHPNRFAAVTSFAYNVGIGAYQKSTMVKKINSEDWSGAQAEFSRWTKAGGRELPGLVRRRQAEAQLFATPHENNKGG
jgi:lysozyme